MTGWCVAYKREIEGVTLSLHRGRVTDIRLRLYTCGINWRYLGVYLFVLVYIAICRLCILARARAVRVTGQRLRQDRLGI